MNEHFETKELCVGDIVVFEVIHDSADRGIVGKIGIIESMGGKEKLIVYKDKDSYNQAYKYIKEPSILDIKNNSLNAIILKMFDGQDIEKLKAYDAYCDWMEEHTNMPIVELKEQRLLPVYAYQVSKYNGNITTFNIMQKFLG